MAEISLEAFRVLQDANPVLNLGGLTVRVPRGTQAIAYRNVSDARFVGEEPAPAMCTCPWNFSFSAGPKERCGTEPGCPSHGDDAPDGADPASR